MGNGIHQMSLVLFTTLAPAGAVAFVAMALMIMLGSIDKAQRNRLNQYLVLPLSIAILGLIASATHLGTPSNALYVFFGVGRSPLSNEVFTAVIFLTLAGLYWLASFSEKLPVWLANIWLFIGCLSALALVAMISIVYSIPTIATWYTIYVPINLCLAATLGGPILGILGIVSAGLNDRVGYFRTLLIIASISLIAGAAVLFMQNADLLNIQNATGVATDLVPYYSLTIVVYVILAALSILYIAIRLQQNGEVERVPAIVSSVLVLLAIFIIRFAFYSMYMTVGL